MLRKLVLGLALAMSTALPLANVAEAAVGDGVVASHGASQLLPIEHVQYVYGGQNYCWYDNGWRGPGYYYCGYAFRTGLGWGGGIGWNNWGGGGWRGGGWHGGGRRRLAWRWRRLAWRWRRLARRWRRLAWRRWRLARWRRRLSRRRWRLSRRRWSAVVVVAVVDAESPHLA